jgi:hypothetical protein
MVRVVTDHVEGELPGELAGHCSRASLRAFGGQIATGLVRAFREGRQSAGRQLLIANCQLLTASVVRNQVDGGRGLAHGAEEARDLAAMVRGVIDHVQDELPDGLAPRVAFQVFVVEHRLRGFAG